MLILGGLKTRSGWCFTAAHVAGVPNTLADGISRLDSPSISANLRRLGPTFVGAIRSWGKRVPIFVRGSWPRVQRPVSYDIISTDLLERFSIVVYFSLPNGSTSILAGQGVGIRAYSGTIAFAAWRCSSERTEVGTISGKLTAVRFFHRRDAGLEHPISSSLIKRALRGMANSHVCLLYTSPSPRD